jgi:general secretion pathway protein D
MLAMFPPAGAAQESPNPADALATEPAASLGGESTGTWRIRSPYPSLPRTQLLLDTIGIEILSSYAPAGGEEDPGKLSGRSGALASRSYSKRVEGNVLRTLETVLAPHPAGGYQIYVRGIEVGADGETQNPELPEIQAAVTRLVEELGSVSGAETTGLDKRQLAYESYQLSYVESDRAIAVLKALGYTTIEFLENVGETLYDRIFVPNSGEQMGEEPPPPRLPLILKMINASKTSLQESTADSGSYGSGGREGLPDLGGIFLHRTTAAEPQNRLLIAYDPFDLESLERLVNLLRDTIDIPARQLVLEALVIEIQGDVTRDLGVSWNAAATLGDTKYDLEIDEGPRLTKPPLTFLFDHASETLAFNLKLHALLQTSRAKILSNPSVLVIDGRQAKIQIGNRIPVVETTITASSATETVLYFPVGIVLNIRPRVSKDGSEISMQVETVVSTARETVASSTSSTRAPEVESRQVQTFVRVQNDTPFIIGGLTTNDEITDKRGVPFLSNIPGLGALFSRQVKENIRKEIIIVVTPHLVPEDPKTFSYVIPQASDIFDSFGRQLLYNAYRIRQQDVYDLDFLFVSRAYRSLLDCASRYVDSVEDWRQTDREVLSLVDGSIPGEEILVRRMLWEIVRKTEYSRFIDPSRVILFEQDPAGVGIFELGFLAPKLAKLEDQNDALVLTFNADVDGTPDHPFSQPTSAISYESITPQTYGSRLAAGNRRSSTGEPGTWSILLSGAYSGPTPPLDVLRGVMVMKWILDLNPNLPLTVRAFSPGRQIVFPTEAELEAAYHLIDPQVAKLFYEVISYYPAFEEEFKQRGRRLVSLMGGCEWWDTGQ